MGPDVIRGGRARARPPSREHTRSCARFQNEAAQSRHAGPKCADRPRAEPSVARPLPARDARARRRIGPARMGNDVANRGAPSHRTGGRAPACPRRHARPRRCGDRRHRRRPGARAGGTLTRSRSSRATRSRRSPPVESPGDGAGGRSPSACRPTPPTTSDPPYVDGVGGVGRGLPDVSPERTHTSSTVEGCPPTTPRPDR